MLEVLNLRQIKSDDEYGSGIKAARLGALSREFNVPPGYVIKREVFDRFIEENQLKGKIRNLVATARGVDDERLQDVANELQKLVFSGRLDDETSESIIEAYYSLNIKEDAPLQELVDSNNDPIAVVRSSPVRPTGNKTNISILHVQGKEKLLKSIIACYSSAFTAEAVRNRLKSGQADYGMAVIIQKMIMPQVSGKIWAEDGVFFINSCFGLSDESTEFDRFAISQELEIMTATAARQKEAYMEDPKTGKLAKIELTDIKAQSRKLSEKQVLALARLYKKSGLEGKAIEYLVDKENYYFVQVLDMEKKPMENKDSSMGTSPQEPEKVIVRTEQKQDDVVKAEEAKENTLFSLFKANRGGKLPDIPTTPQPDAKPKPEPAVQAEPPKTKIVEEESPAEDVTAYEEEEEQAESQEEEDHDTEKEPVGSDDLISLSKEEEVDEEEDIHPLTKEEWFDTLRMEHTKMLISYDLVILNALKSRYFRYFKEEAPNFEEMIDKLNSKIKVPYVSEIKKIRRLRNDFLQSHKPISMEELKESYEATVLFLREFS